MDLVEFVGCEVIEGAVEPALVKPFGPTHREELDIVDGLQRAAQERALIRYRLGLNNPIVGFANSFVGILASFDRSCNTLAHERSRERDRGVPASLPASL
jgi:hypothetical protein